MRCKWNGIFAADASAVEPVSYLVLLPLSEINADIQNTISRCTGFPLIEIKTQIKAQGFSVLDSGRNRDVLEKKAAALRQSRIACAVFTDTYLFDVPQINFASSGAISPDTIVFLNKNEEETARIGKNDSLLLVRARVETFAAAVKSAGKKKQHIVGRMVRHATITGQVGGMIKNAATPRTVTVSEAVRTGILDIFNMTAGAHVRIMEGKFNFRKTLANDSEYSYIANEKIFLEKLRGVTTGIVIDEHFDRSSLPYTGAAYIKTTDGESQSGSLVNTSENNEMDRFSHYSRFRYIVQTLTGKQ